MDTTATHGTHDTTEAVLYLAFELSSTRWCLGFTVGMGQRPRRRTIEAGDVNALQQELQRAKQRFSLAQDVRVVSCYEAGRDGFWLDRYLKSVKIDNRVVDLSSIEVNRRARRAKTDRLDLDKLLAMLIRYYGGEEKVWRVVHVPTVAEEDWRQLHRSLKTLKRARTRQINRLKGLLASQGVQIEVHPDFLERLAEIRTWDGSQLPNHLRARLQREFERLTFTEQQIKAVEAERLELIRSSDDPFIKKVRQLLLLKGIGVNGAWLFTMEFFAWRQFRNRRQVGALAGLTPTPYASGSSNREQGISKAGNRHVRGLAIEIAWIWLRYQPDSELSRWYQERFGHGNSRLRRIGIVALARKLLIALWRYLETGRVPAGAILKSKPI